jgi:DnaJ-class molecular chaperone
LHIAAIGNAFAVLSDPAKRQRYDEYGIEDSSSHRSHRHGYDNDYTRGFEGDDLVLFNPSFLVIMIDHFCQA